MKLDFEKMGGLIPAIVQDNNTNKVLMLGFMNEEAYEETKETGKVTFFSRTKNRLWIITEMFHLSGTTRCNDRDMQVVRQGRQRLVCIAVFHTIVCHTGKQDLSVWILKMEKQ